MLTPLIIKSVVYVYTNRLYVGTMACNNTKEDQYIGDSGGGRSIFLGVAGFNYKGQICIIYLSTM
jgi:hypothetical protein